MSLIQKIRDKYARVAVVAIALALLGFILMDALGSRSSLFGGRGNTLGKINGRKIEYEAFSRRVNDISRAQGPNAGDLTPQIVNSLWEQEVQNEVMGEQYEALGLTVTKKELDGMLYSATPSQAVLQAFGNPQQWDPNIVRQRISQIEKSGAPQEKEQLKEAMDLITRQTLQAKYTALLTSSVYIPKWFLEKRNADNGLMAKAAYVGVPYTSIADSTVKVTDAEILDYAKAHKKDYEIKEETRSVSYVQFSAAPSSADSAAARNGVTGIVDSFQRIADMKEFVKKAPIGFNYNDAWYAAADIPFQNKDTMLKAPIGTVTGPYVENGQYILTKVIDKKTQPDTAKVRHILIQTAQPDQQSGGFIPTRDTVSARKTADSVQAAIAAGAPFDSLMVKLSDDPGKVQNKGVYDSITRNAQLMQEFKDFALNSAPGSKGIVKTAYGYHYMELLNQRGSSPVYKLALYGKAIEATKETGDRATEAANLFAGNAKDEKSFKDYFDKNIKGKNLATSDAPSVATLRPMDFSLPTLNASARPLIKKIFEAKKGQVLDPETIGENTVVAVVTDVSEPGVPSATTLRPQIEPLLVNKKKAAKIKEQMGTVTDLNAVAAKFKQTVQPADSVRFSGGGILGFETKVIGALFNPASKGKTVSEPIVGNNGVYAIRVDNTFSTPVDKAGIEQQRQMMEMQSRRTGSPVELLKKRITIKDNRAEFY